MQRAITFDFWDTIVIDESDEPKRAMKGLSQKLSHDAGCSSMMSLQPIPNKRSQWLTLRLTIATRSFVIGGKSSTTPRTLGCGCAKATRF